MISAGCQDHRSKRSCHRPCTKCGASRDRRNWWSSWAWHRSSWSRRWGSWASFDGARHKCADRFGCRCTEGGDVTWTSRPGTEGRWLGVDLVACGALWTGSFDCQECTLPGHLPGSQWCLAACAIPERREHVRPICPAVGWITSWTNDRATPAPSRSSSCNCRHCSCWSTSWWGHRASHWVRGTRVCRLQRCPAREGHGIIQLWPCMHLWGLSERAARGQFHFAWICWVCLTWGDLLLSSFCWNQRNMENDPHRWFSIDRFIQKPASSSFGISMSFCLSNRLLI